MTTRPEPRIPTEGVVCGTCGSEVFDGGSTLEEREPCPECGSLARHFTRVITEHLGGSSSASLEEVAALTRRVRELEEQTRREEMTGLLNKRGIEHAIAETIGGSIDPFAVIFIDLDGFKKVNDGHGHLAGNDVLIELASRLGSAIGGDGEIGRWAGDEFLVLLPGLDEAGGGRMAESLCRVINDSPIVVATGPAIAISASVGVGACPLHGRTVSDVIRAADRAMYAAKALGGNCWAIAPAPKSGT